jgi:CHAT domain-containing protein
MRFGQLVSPALLGALSLGAWTALAPGQPVSLPDELTPAQRQQLEKTALALNQLSRQRLEEGRVDEAVQLTEQVVRLCRRLYPPERYPDGHRDLVVSLNNLGELLRSRGDLVQAELPLRQALAMCEKLYAPARYPDGHADLARNLSSLAQLLQARGELTHAEPLFRRTLSMYQKLYPPERFPDGHPSLASSLNNLGMLLQLRRELARAEPFLRDALSMLRQLYPPERFPDGHPDLAYSLTNLGTLLHARDEPARAEPLARDAVAMMRKLYPPTRYPLGHPGLAICVNNLGGLLKDRGELVRAEPLLREALTIRQQLYPPTRFPGGHPDLAVSLLNLGGLLQARGELARAEPLLADALAMMRKLYPPTRCPHGYPDLALSLDNLGRLLQSRGELGRAEPLLREALVMRQKLYPPAHFPNGHPYLVASLNNLGQLHHDRGELDRAKPLLEDALAMCRKLYPPTLYPSGHHELTPSLNNLGGLLWERGELAAAEKLYADALAMHRKLRSPERYPDGHPDLAVSLVNLGALFYARGELDRAEPLLREATATNQRLASALLAGSAEAEGLNYLARLPTTLEPYLSITWDLPDKTESAYQALWHAKGVLTHMLQQRRLTLLAARDQTTRALAEQLAASRQALANLLRPGVAAPPERVRELSDRKERQEKQLAEQLPLYQALRQHLQRGPADLIPLLPPGTVYCDLTRYRHITHDPRARGGRDMRRRLRYVAFVLTRDQPIRRVELGDAEPIDAAVAEWRRSVQDGQGGSPATRTLHRQLWEPLARVFPAQTHTVLLAPDAALTGVPWAALPGRRPGTVLLEDNALATVANGPLLLDQLHAPPCGKTGAGLLLTVGGIDYDSAAGSALPAATAAGLARAAPESKGEALWPALPGTARELAVIRRLAGQRSIIQRQGAAAGTGQLLADLPKARWAHLATHGFFADPAQLSVFQLSAGDYQPSRFGERSRQGARSPLVLSGLVCAGANRPVKNPELEDGGILTAEAIAGLNLDGLELAVLSACETGLGESGGGEGVFGLQRAFHLAGTRSVVASLWKIDDAATQALMAEFYRNLWERKLPRLEALRRAQLAMLLHYDAKDGRLRAPGAAVPVDPAELAAAREKLRTAGRPPLPPLYWAGFVLSGDWR